MTPRRSDQGSAAIEVVLLTPAFLLVLALVILAGRIGARRADVEGVAHSAARQISMARQPIRALAPARAEAATSLRAGSALCRQMGWQVSLRADEVAVTITCMVDLSDTALLPIPGTFTVEATAREVIDQHREHP